MTQIEKTQWMNQLLDAYGSLLTPKQQEVFHAYYEEDFSLSEIAEEFVISRAAVSDHLKRGEKMLEEYEKKLKLVDKSTKRQEIYVKIKTFKNKDINIYVEALEGLE